MTWGKGTPCVKQAGATEDGLSSPTCSAESILGATRRGPRHAQCPVHSQIKVGHPKSPNITHADKLAAQS